MGIRSRMTRFQRGTRFLASSNIGRNVAGVRARGNGELRKARGNEPVRLSNAIALHRRRASLWSAAMSEKRTYRINCPKCSHEQSVELHESVNVKTNPELKEALLKNQLNQVACGKCQFSFRVDKQLVYNDPERRVLIYWFPSSDTPDADSEEKFIEAVAEITRALPEGAEAPSVHLVFNRTELIERIFLKEAGLDERIIEYIKYTMYTRNAKRLDPNTKALLFNAHDSNDSALCFIVQDLGSKKFEAVLNYDRKSYDALKETFTDEEKSFDLLELFPGPHISARQNLLRELNTEPEAEEE